MSGLLALSFWISQLGEVFDTFSTSESNIGLFLLVVLFAVAVGLEVNLLRWAIFEKLICRKEKLELKHFANLGDPSRLTAFRAAADEHYRYHQFWGSMAVLIPFIAVGSSRVLLVGASQLSIVAFWVLSFFIEVATVLGAREAYLRYVARANQIMKGREDA
jgi:hypothetical protein